VPRENVLGGVGQGYKIAIETLTKGGSPSGAQMIGLARGALDHAVAYARQRSSSARPSANFRGVQFELARMATRWKAARLLVYNAARLRDAGMPFLTEAAMAKYYSSEIAEKVASKAIEVHGGVGLRRITRWKSCIGTPRSGASTRHQQYSIADHREKLLGK